MSATPEINGFFDEVTNSVSYLVADPESREAAVIDPVLDFDPASGTIATKSADEILASAKERGLRIAWVLETHVHADHLSAAAEIRRQTGAKIAIGVGVRDVQALFGPIFGAIGIAPDGDDFDQLLNDGDTISLGELTIEAIATPGHTPACLSYRVGDAVFVGDTLFMPDYGTARTDFPGGDAAQLYRSIQRIFALPRETRLFMCHDYKAPGRSEYAWETTVGEETDRNVHIGGDTSEQAFVEMRRARDTTLCAPKLLYPAIQVNIRGGRLPPPDEDGRRYVRVPLTVPPGVL
jgi:glyoxylase-like metal-dependent hydrolase (beta-lactamase superfamily II)